MSSEQLRRLAARGTREVLRRRGDELGMFIGCGFPKSGTVWLCQLMGTALGVPYPREYRSPIAMAAVIHAHWRFDPSFPSSAYIRRDGRDVVVSRYFYYVRALTGQGKPRRARRLHAIFHRLYGPRFDPDDARGNLPRFIEAQFAEPLGSAGLAWHQHIEDWWDRPRVTHVSYEQLLEDPVPIVTKLMDALGGRGDPRIARATVDRWSFATTTQRLAGDEDRQSFQRKGVAGDWRNHFSREAGEVFDSCTGDALIDLGYETDRDWYRHL